MGLTQPHMRTPINPHIHLTSPISPTASPLSMPHIYVAMSRTTTNCSRLGNSQNQDPLSRTVVKTNGSSTGLWMNVSMGVDINTSCTGVAGPSKTIVGYLGLNLLKLKHWMSG